MEIDRNSPIQTPAVRNGINRYNFLGKETQIATGYIDLQARFYDPLIGRFMQVDPVTELQESQSVYQYGWNNPILRSDPNGTYPGGPGDDPFLIARLATTAFYDIKHAAYNTAFRLTNAPLRADYKVDGDGNQTFETQISRQTVDNSLSGQAREAVSAVGDVALVATAGLSPANPGNLLSKTSVESQVVKAGKEVASEISRKGNGAFTEPTLPPKTIVNKDGVQIVHYTKSGDHGPPHVHVKGGGAETRIGQNGKPLKNNPSLTTDQQSVVNDYKKDIRNAVKKIGAWFNYNQQ